MRCSTYPITIGIRFILSGLALSFIGIAQAALPQTGAINEDRMNEQTSSFANTQQKSISSPEAKEPTTAARKKLQEAAWLFRNQQFKDIIPACNDAIRLNNGSYARALTYRGRAEQSLGLKEAAIKTYAEALAIRPTDYQTRTLLAEAKFEAGSNTEEVINALRGIIKSYPLYEYAYVLLGDVLFKRGDKIGAEQALRQAIEIDPNFPPGRMILAQLLLSKDPSAKRIEMGREVAALPFQEAVGQAEIALRLFSEVRASKNVSPDVSQDDSSQLILGGGRYIEERALAEALYTVSKAYTRYAGWEENRLTDTMLITFLDKGRVNIDQALQIAQRFPNKLQLFYLLHLSAENALMKGENARALRDAAEALQIAETLSKTDLANDIYELNLLLYEAYYFNKDYSQAAKSLRRGLAVYETKLPETERQRLRELISESEAQSKLEIPALKNVTPPSQTATEADWTKIVTLRRITKLHRTPPVPRRAGSLERAPLLSIRWGVAQPGANDKTVLVDPTRFFRPGEKIHFIIEVNQAGYLYLVDEDNLTVIFPDARINGGKSLVQKGQAIVIPSNCDRLYQDPNGQCWFEIAPANTNLMLIFSRDRIDDFPRSVNPDASIAITREVLNSIKSEEQKILEVVKPLPTIIQYTNPNRNNNEELVVHSSIKVDRPSFPPPIFQAPQISGQQPIPGPASTAAAQAMPPPEVLQIKADVYREKADQLLTQNRLPEARQTIELLKKEEYVEASRPAEQALAKRTTIAQPDEAPVARMLSVEEKEWQKRYTEIDRRLALVALQRNQLLLKTSLTAAEETQLKSLEQDLMTAQQAFRKFLDDLLTETSSNGQSTKVVFDLKESQGLISDLQELGQNTAAIYTVLTKNKLRLILVTSTYQRGSEYAIKDTELKQKVMAFRKALQNPQSDPLPLAQELYRILLGPLAQDLKAIQVKTLMWSLDGVLRYLPVAALHDGKQYVVENYRNVIFTPASLPRLKDAPGQQWKVLGLGLSKGNCGAPPLPAVEAELQKIIRVSPRQTTGTLPGTIKLNQDFTFDALRLANRGQYAVVHIASHFQFQPGNRKNSYLLLGDCEKLNLEQISVWPQLFNGVDLLTLSACDTATGEAMSDGIEVESFAVLSQRQGAKAIIATLWPVADQSTALLMQQFYQRKQQNPSLTKAEGLQQAQQTLLLGIETARDTQTNPAGARGVRPNNDGHKPTAPPNPQRPYAHPYYWAPFILIGNWK